ncbi:MAG: ABC transporter ATP-binding protein [Rhodospirillaceae bacterium]
MLLDISDLTSHYGRLQALRGISLTIGQGELIALIGANGAGKTSLLQAISGVRAVSGGRMRFEGRDLAGLAPERRVDLGIVQVPEGRQVFASLSVEDNLRLGAYRRRDREIAADLARMIELFPVLGRYRNLTAGSLSGGQQQMLALARGLMARPRLLLLDEPSMGLSPVLVAEVFQVIADLRRAGTTIFLVEQNARSALAIADRAYVIETGAVVLSGSGAGLLADDRVRTAYLGL